MRDFFMSQSNVLNGNTSVQSLKMSKCGIVFNSNSSPSKSYKPDFFVIMEIIETLKNSLKWLDLSENDLRFNKNGSHFGFLLALEDIYLSTNSGKNKGV